MSWSKEIFIEGSYVADMPTRNSSIISHTNITHSSEREHELSIFALFDFTTQFGVSDLEDLELHLKYYDEMNLTNW